MERSLTESIMERSLQEFSLESMGNKIKAVANFIRISKVRVTAAEKGLLTSSSESPGWRGPRQTSRETWRCPPAGCRLQVWMESPFLKSTTRAGHGCHSTGGLRAGCHRGSLRNFKPSQSSGKHPCKKEPRSRNVGLPGRAGSLPG